MEVVLPENGKGEGDSKNGSLSGDTEDEIEKYLMAVKERIYKPELLKKKRKEKSEHSQEKRKEKEQTLSVEESDSEVSEGQKAYREWRKGNMPVLPLKNIKHTIRCLNQDKPKPSLIEWRLQKFCREKSAYATSFDSSTCIFAAIRRCILTRNWNRLPQLLLIFIKSSESRWYRNYIREVG